MLAFRNAILHNEKNMKKRKTLRQKGLPT